MTTTAIRCVGYCAHYSPPGDWAFEYALELARSKQLQLNIFHFLSDPYDPEDRKAEKLDPDQRTELIVERERKLRTYYDSRLGDYLDVGFRLCEDREWLELHRCLTKREFQVLVLGRPDYRVNFAGKPLEEFADEFVCPVVLIGPSSPTEIRLNSPARLIADTLGLPNRLEHLFRLNRFSAACAAEGPNRPA
jgi:hypothetical protein